MFIPALPARYSPGGKTKCLRRRCSLARIGVASTKQGVYLQHPGNQAHVLWDFQGASLITLLNQYQPLFYLPQRLTSWPIQKQKTQGILMLFFRLFHMDVWPTPLYGDGPQLVHMLVPASSLVPRQTSCNRLQPKGNTWKYRVATGKLHKPSCRTLQPPSRPHFQTDIEQQPW